MVFGYLLEPHIEIDQEIFFNDFFFIIQKLLNFQQMFFKDFMTVQKFGSKEKRLHHMVEQKRHIGIITKTFSPFFSQVFDDLLKASY